eukprot:COSAG01_NODE_1_length_100484_cov_170.446142_8_plen_370_part_00
MPDHKTKEIKANTPVFQRSLKPAQQHEGAYCYIENKRYLNLSSNDYLGLSQEPPLIKIAQDTLEQYGMGSTGSRLLSGDFESHHALEKALAQYYQQEAALLFNTGYQGNLAVISSLFNKHDIIFADKHIHACCIDACRLAGVTLKRYAHLDTTHLERLLQTHRKNHTQALILSESVFSMDGDSANITQLIALKKEYNCQLMIDDAHGFGVFPALNNPDIDLLTATFGKALGSFGAFLICRDVIKQRLINQARGFIYSTALPLPVVAWNKAALALLPDLNNRQTQLLKLADWLREACEQAGFRHLGNSHIIPLIFDNLTTCKALVAQLNKIGIQTNAILPPTVAAHACRIRISLTALITKKMLRPLVDKL